MDPNLRSRRVHANPFEHNKAQRTAFTSVSSISSQHTQSSQLSAPPSFTARLQENATPPSIKPQMYQPEYRENNVQQAPFPPVPEPAPSDKLHDYLNSNFEEPSVGRMQAPQQSRFTPVTPAPVQNFSFDQPSYDSGYNDTQDSVLTDSPRGFNFAGRVASAASASKWLNPIASITGGFGQQLARLGEAYNQQTYDPDFQDPPFLEELGVDVDDILAHVRAVLLFKRDEVDKLNYGDITGPIVILLILGFMLLLTGRVAFSVIYATDVLGTICIYVMLNFTSQDAFIELSRVIVILGYSLLPICMAPMVWVVSSFAFTFVRFGLLYGLVGWSTFTATLQLEKQLNMQQRKYFLVFPTLLYYLYFIHLAIG